jgi:hypothetical protein
LREDDLVERADASYGNDVAVLAQRREAAEHLRTHRLHVFCPKAPNPAREADSLQKTALLPAADRVLVDPQLSGGLSDLHQLRHVTRVGDKSENVNMREMVDFLRPIRFHLNDLAAHQAFLPLRPGEHERGPGEGVGEFAARLGVSQPKLSTPEGFADLDAVVNEFLVEARHQECCRPILNRPLRRDDGSASGNQQRRTHRGHLIGKVRHVQLRRLTRGQHRNPG